MAHFLCFVYSKEIFSVNKSQWRPHAKQSRFPRSARTFHEVLMNQFLRLLHFGAVFARRALARCSLKSRLPQICLSTNKSNSFARIGRKMRGTREELRESLEQLISTRCWKRAAPATSQRSSSINWTEIFTRKAFSRIGSRENVYKSRPRMKYAFNNFFSSHILATWVLFSDLFNKRRYLCVCLPADSINAVSVFRWMNENVNSNTTSALFPPYARSLRLSTFLLLSFFRLSTTSSTIFGTKHMWKRFSLVH